MELNKKKREMLLVFFFILFPIAAFYLMEAYEHNAFAEVRPMAAFFNIILFELIAWALYFLIGQMHIAIRIELGTAVVFGLVNHYVMAFRSTPFVPWDIFSVNTAASVAKNYDFTPDLRVVMVTLGFIGLMIAAQVLKGGLKIVWKIRLGSAVLVILALCLFVNALQQEEFQTKNNLYPFLFTPVYMTKVNGMAVTFAMNLAYVVVDKPQGYSAEESREILESYEKDEPLGEEADLPNIIVVMDEAFSDLAVLGPLETNEDYMPFMHRMQQGADNTITGYVQVSVCGGNTANSEFEFLTGNTMAFLPGGSIPYQQYIKKKTPSLASYLEELGYAAYAQHPYGAHGWDRDKVYPLFGFEDMDFLPDYTNKTYVREYVSDASDMRHIIDTFENKEEGKPAFIFNVTMQNHGGYTQEYDNLQEEIHSQYNSPQLDRYLSLVNLTDEALENLVNYFSQVDEKTVIVFFGDHQPGDAVTAPVEKGLQSGDEETDYTKRYQVPYLIWANYEIESASGKDTSLNYLAAQVLKAAGVPTNAYQNYLLELSENYPVLSAAGKTEAAGEEDLLQTYQKLQYYNIFEGEQQ